MRIDSLPITPEKVLRGILARDGALATRRMTEEEPMLKVLSLMKRKEGMSYDEFRNWALNEHPKLATKIPGMRGYRMNVPVKENPDSPYDAISEMWWDSDEARLAGFGTDEGKAAGADAAAHAASRFHFFAEEKVFIS